MQKYTFSTVINHNDVIHTDVLKWVKDNREVRAVTIALAPEHMPNHTGFEQDIFRYCAVREIIFRLWMEHENTNTHYHGVVLYPSPKAMKNLQLWITKKYGKILHATLYDPDGWIDYCTKNDDDDKKNHDIISYNLSSCGDKSAASYLNMFRLKYMFDRRSEDYVPTEQDLQELQEWEMQHRERDNDEYYIQLPVELTD